MNNPNVLYASLWEAYRQSWQMSSGGPGTGLFKSTDGGDTWTEFTRAPGLPAQGPLGKIGIAVSRVDSNRLWVLLEHENGGLFMSDDAGATWKLVNDDRNIRQRAFYYSRVYADPKQKDTVWMLNVNMYRSTDAGKTLQNVRAPHGDYHDLWIDPDDSAHLVNANDGGGTVSWNNRRDLDRSGVSNRAALSPERHQHVPVLRLRRPAGQLHRLRAGAARCRATSAPGYFSAGGGESGYVTPHPTNRTCSTRAARARSSRASTSATGHVRDIQPYPRFFSGEPAKRSARAVAVDVPDRVRSRSMRTRSTSRRSTSGRRPTTGRAGPKSART